MRHARHDEVLELQLYDSVPLPVRVSCVGLGLVRSGRAHPSTHSEFEYIQS